MNEDDLLQEIINSLEISDHRIDAGRLNSVFEFIGLDFKAKNESCRGAGDGTPLINALLLMIVHQQKQIDQLK